MSVLQFTQPARWVCRACQSNSRRLLVSLRKQRYSSEATTAASPSRQWSTPLAKTIGEVIKTTGPISIAQYMRQCLTSSEGGYYTRQAKEGDQFGQKGDFITSPEISQVFGELLGLWFVTEWMAQGRPKTGVELIEAGPGRGTLMDDMLRAIRNFKSFVGSIESVYMIEASPNLREKQKELLCGSDAQMQETEVGWRSYSKYNNIPVTWCEDIRHLHNAPDRTPFIIAHEFFDALPIHAFRAVPPATDRKDPSPVIGLDGKPIEFKSTPTESAKTHQWRELLVTLADQKKDYTPKHKPYSNVSDATADDFQLVQAPSSTPSSLVIPETSPRYRALKATSDAVIEISPDSHSYMGEFAVRVGGGNKAHGSPRAASSPSLSPSATTLKPRPSGAALILDYGTLDTVPMSTLRGIRQHELVSPFTTPGLTDLSADVDFTAMAEAAINASPGVEVHGPVEQATFLESMGIRERAAVLEKNARKDGDKAGEIAAKRIKGAVERLVERGGGGMGKIYKALAIIPENGGRRRPVGFGGQVVM